MAVTATDLLAEVRAGAPETDRAQRSVDEASARVDAYIARTLTDPANPVPEESRDGAVLAAAVDWFNRTKAPNGQLMAQYDAGNDGTAAPSRINRDPLATARPMLAEWCWEGGVA